MVGQRGAQAFCVLVVTGLLAGCAPGAASAQGSRASQMVGEVVTSVSGDRSRDINGFARSAAASIDGDGSVRGRVDLVAIEESEPASLGDPFGTLTFRVQLPEDDSGYTLERAFDACFTVEFDYYGVSDERIWESSSYLREQACPADVAVLVPPIDTSIRYVVAANAEAAAMGVLSDETAAVEDADGITARILALLEVSAGGYEQVAPPTVIVDDGDVGVAMGAADDCVLVSRVDGVVSRVMPAPILLQPGELGCQPGTALIDPAQLRSPH